MKRLVLIATVALLVISRPSMTDARDASPTSTAPATASDSDTAIDRIGRAVADRYVEFQASLSPAAAAEEAELSALAGAPFSLAYSARGFVRSLWGWRMRIPAPPTAFDDVERAIVFVEENDALFGISAPTSIKILDARQRVDGVGTVVRLGQTAFELPVFTTGMVIHIGIDGDIEWLSGNLLPDAAFLPTTPQLPASEAASDLPGRPTRIELGWVDPEFLGAQPDAPARLVWRVRLDDGQYGQDAYRDAVTGEIVARATLADFDEHKEIFECIDPGGCANNDPALPGRIVHDDFCHTDPIEGPVCPAGKCIGGVCQDSWAGTTEQVATKMDQVHDFYWGRLGRDSWDDLQCGSDPICTNFRLHRMRATADSGGTCTAAWRSSASDVVGPAQIVLSSDIVCLDVIGHELTHGVDEVEGNITGDNCNLTSWALDEGIPDVFGELIEKNATGSVDWVGGAACAACAAGGRNYANPGAVNGRCVGKCNGGDVNKPHPDHWSNYDNTCGGHWNSTIVSKAGYLMARAPAEGSASHWGLTVTGVGAPISNNVWYSTLTSMPTAATLVDFRNRVYSACATHAGSSYANCIASVDAVGLWSGDSTQSWSVESNTTVSFGRRTIISPRRYIFYKVTGTTGALRFRYRTCTLESTSCSWTAEFTLDDASSSPSSAEIPGGDLWTCFRGPGGVAWCDRITFNGAIAYGPDPAVAIVGEPSVVYFNGLLYIVYRKSDNRIYWKTTAGSVWSAEHSEVFQASSAPILASSNEDWISPSNTDLWLVYPRISDNRIAYRRFDTGTSTWGAERLMPNGSLTTSTTRLAASVFRQRLHVAKVDATQGTYYASCGSPCSSESVTDWTRFVRQEGGSGNIGSLDSYGAADGFLHLWRREVSANQPMRRRKVSR